MSKSKFKNTILLWGSFSFYFWGEPRFFFVAVLSAYVDYQLGQKIAMVSGFRAKRYLIVGILVNVLLLFIYKYLDFFIAATHFISISWDLPKLPCAHIALPIGISFIVFEKITYLVDIYRKVTSPATNLKQYLLYVFLFPKLLAGPIVKYHEISPQFKGDHLTAQDFFEGSVRFLQGLIKKVLLADTIAELADTIFNLPAEELSCAQAWLGLLSFSLQIYLDFSAYSDMAIGLARMFGFKLMENFNMPYIALNFTDFWRRWHISLSTWIREYLYIPLGGNRLGTTRTYLNLWICFFLSGLWHGASWTYILWGAYHGFFLVLDKLFWLKLSQRLPKSINLFLTLFFVTLGWVIFRTTSLHQLDHFLQALFFPNQKSTFIYITANIWTALIIGSAMSLMPAIPIVTKQWHLLNTKAYREKLRNWCISMLSFLAISRVCAASITTFLYFRF